MYVPLAIVWFDVDGWYVVALFVVTLPVSDTEVFPEVPLEIYPAETCGVLLTVFVSVSVFVPVDTVADVPLIEDAGVALPLDTVFVALLA